MANDTMKKVQELLEMVGLDKEVIKSVTEKLNESKCDDGDCKGKTCKKDDEEKVEDDKVVVDAETEEDEKDKKEEASESAVTTAHVKFQKEDDEHQKKAPVDSSLAKGIAIHEDEEITEALYVLRDAIAEARDQYITMENDLAILKEEYAKLVAEKMIAEAQEEIEEGEHQDPHIQLELAKDEKSGAKEDEAEEEEDRAEEDEEKKEKHEEEGDKDEAEGKKEEAKKEDEEADKAEEHAEKDEKKAEKDEEEEKADESLKETANQILKDLGNLSESEETTKVQKKSNVYSAFSNLNESLEVKEEKKNPRKAFTLFPNLR